MEGVTVEGRSRPPPPAPEILRVAEHDEGSGVPAEWA